MVAIGQFPFAPVLPSAYLSLIREDIFQNLIFSSDSNVAIALFYKEKKNVKNLLENVMSFVSFFSGCVYC